MIVYRVQQIERVLERGETRVKVEGEYRREKDSIQGIVKMRVLERGKTRGKEEGGYRREKDSIQGIVKRASFREGEDKS